MPKRLLLLSFDFPPKRGGISTYAWEIASSFGDQEIKVIAPKTKLSFKKEDRFPFELERIFTSSRSLISVLFFFFALLRHRSKDTSCLCTNWFPCGLSAFLSGTPYFITAHGAEYFPRPGVWGSFKAFLCRKVLEKAEGVFAVSSFTAEKVKKIGEPRNIWIVPNGVNRNTFFPQKKLSDNFPPVVLGLGRLEAHKGFDTALDAFSILKKRNIAFSYWIAGTGKEESNLKQKTMDLGLSENVFFLGDVPQEKICDLYNKIDLFLLLSREENDFAEGFGLVFLEAAACGKTAIGTFSGGIPDAIKNGQTGILIAPNSPQAAADALEKLLLNSELRKNLGENALRRVREELNWPLVTKKMQSNMEGNIHA